MRYALAIAAASVFALTSHNTANAYADGCAVVLRTPDGFLSLRKDPKMGSTIIGRLKPGELIVVAGETMAMKWALVSIDDRRKKGWAKNGWASTRYLKSVDCDDE